MSRPTTQVAILDDYQGVALDLADWASLGDDVEVTSITQHLPDRDAVVEVLAPYDVVVANRERTPLDAATLAGLPALRLVVTFGTRNSSIDVAAAAAQGIVVSGCRGFGDPTAELVWGLVIGFLRHLPAELAAVRAGGWQTTLGTALEGRTMGVLGFGRIGGDVARVARAFKMDVLAWSRAMNPERAEAGGAVAATLDEVLAGSDVVSIHLPLNASTRGLVGREQLAAMRPGALLVNTSRGPIVDHDALVEALQLGVIRGAALDVWDLEPAPADEALRHLPNVVATPHLGYVTEENYRAWMADAVEDVAAWRAGAPLRVVAPPA